MQFSFSLMSNSTPSRSLDAGDDDSAESDAGMKRASAYTLLHHCATGDLVMMTPDSFTDQSSFVGVVLQYGKGFNRQPALLLTEFGLFEALPFLINTSRYYTLVYLHRKNTGINVVGEYLRKFIGPVAPDKVALPFVSSPAANSAFNRSVLKVLNDGKMPTTHSFIDDLEDNYINPCEVVFMYNE